MTRPSAPPKTIPLRGSPTTSSVLPRSTSCNSFSTGVRSRPQQFAHIELALAQNAYVIEGGEIQLSGTAAELRDNPDLIKAAYLLGSEKKEQELT